MDIRQTSGSALDPIPGQTYGGFAAARPATSQNADRPLRSSPADAGGATQAGASWRRFFPASRGKAIGALVAIAAVTGGVMTRLPWSPPHAQTQAQTQARTQAPIAAPTAEPLRPAPAPVAGLKTAPAAEALPASPPVSAPAVKVASSTSIARPAKSGPSAGCKAEAGGAGRAVCPDIAFAALDRQVNAAFAAAMRSGAPAGALGQQQQDWIIRRDRVRREDPNAAKDLYLARIAELHALASRGGEPAPASVAQDASESPR